MKKLFHSTFATLVLAGFLAVAPPMYARGGHGGHRGGHGGHAGGHAAAAHVRGGHHAVGVRGGRGHNFAGHARGYARHAGRAYYTTGGRYWGGNWAYPYYGSSRFGLGYYGLGYSYPYYGYYGYRSGGWYDPYYPYFPYRYGYWPYLCFSFGFY